MKKSVLAIILMMMFSVMAFASNGGSGGGDGDKVKNPWQNVSDEDCALWSPEGLTSEICVDDHDGVSGQDYLCTLPATCPDGLVPSEDEESES